MPLAPPDTPMDRALLLMTEKRFGCLGVVDAAGRLIGIVTDGDLRRAMGPDLLSRQVVDVMTSRAAHDRARCAGRRGAARHERARPSDHLPVRRRCRRPADSASCTSTTCCARGWHERSDRCAPDPRRSAARASDCSPPPPDAFRQPPNPGGLARRRIVINVDKWLLPDSRAAAARHDRALAGDRPPARHRRAIAYQRMGGEVGGATPDRRPLSWR